MVNYKKMEFNNFNYSPEPLLYKPDWPRVCKWWIAFWERQPIDRPLIDVKAPRPGEHKEIPIPTSLEDLYFSPDYIVSSTIAMFESTYFGGESVPARGALMGGYALGCGEKVKFAPNTVWHPVIIDSMEEPVNWHPGPDDPWRKKLEKVVDRLLSIASGKFLVGYVGQVPVNDLLFLLRGTKNFLMDLADNIELCCQRLRETFPLHLEVFNYFRKLIDSRQKDGCVWNWPGLWSHYFVKTTQSDMSCMISTEMFKKYVMTEMDLLGEEFGRLWYHLDGPGAIRHLPVLLSRSYMKAIQYVPGAGDKPNGPAYLEMYRQIQKAKRCLDISVPLENVKFLIQHLNPEGLVIRTRVETSEQADELLLNAVKWAGTHKNQKK